MKFIPKSDFTPACAPLYKGAQDIASFKKFDPQAVFLVREHFVKAVVMRDPEFLSTLDHDALSDLIPDEGEQFDFSIPYQNGVIDHDAIKTEDMAHYQPMEAALSAPLNHLARVATDIACTYKQTEHANIHLALCFNGPGTIGFAPLWHHDIAPRLFAPLCGATLECNDTNGDIELDAGDMALYENRFIHRSSRNISKMGRIAVIANMCI